MRRTKQSYRDTRVGAWITFLPASSLAIHASRPLSVVLLPCLLEFGLVAFRTPVTVEGPFRLLLNDAQYLFDLYFIQIIVVRLFGGSYFAYHLTKYFNSISISNLRFLWFCFFSCNSPILPTFRPQILQSVIFIHCLFYLFSESFSKPIPLLPPASISLFIFSIYVFPFLLSFFFAF